MENKTDKLKLILLAAIFFLIVLLCWFKNPDEFSDSERRALAQKAEFSAETVLNGQFMSDFESYSLDQFPMRDKFRSLKALSEYGLLQKKDNNKIYIEDGYAAQILYPLNENSVNHALEKFEKIYESNIKGTGSRVFASVIPDKGYFLAEAKGYPALDYERMFKMVSEGMDYAKYIDITGNLSLKNYYKTDTHWRQESLIPAAKHLGQNMGLSMKGLDDLEEFTAKEDFRGVYYGQSALPLQVEPLNYVTGESIENAKVMNLETNQTLDVYNKEKLTAKDPYDLFLGGASALLTVTNEDAETDRELILFRDSFGSSIAPLFIDEYKKITLIDIRYLQSDFIGQLVDFHGQDVLFLYGAAMLNDSFSFK